MFRPIKNIIEELKHTTWPNWKTLLNLVLYTVITCGIITVLIVGLDIFLAKIRDLIL